jgi:hypothetical protein
MNTRVEFGRGGFRDRLIGRAQHFMSQEKAALNLMGDCTQSSVLGTALLIDLLCNWVAGNNR